MKEEAILDDLFRNAVQLIDAGDLAGMQRLLDKHPRIVHERLVAPGAWLRNKIGGALDGLFKDPYLLWFVAEDLSVNGRLPANIADIAAAIIHHAKKEQVSSLQEQLDFTLKLVCWSGIAKECGVQLALVDLLIDEGATPCNPNEALVCYNTDAARLLIKRGAPLTFAAAICLERIEDIATLATTADEQHRQGALVLAALNGNARAIKLMTELGGFDVNDPCPDIYSHATPLHHAVCSGSLDAVKAMVEAGADVNIKDTAWGGTPLGWAEHYLSETNSKGEYKEIFDYLKDK